MRGRCPADCQRVITKSTSHDDSHPDHVSDEFMSPDMYNSNDNKFDSNEIVERHRKVYLSDKQLNNNQPIIHPISITIPVRLDDGMDVDLPEPKPLFKMRKYTYKETKKETEMVPITTTIIKPVGVAKEQIIDDESLAD